MLLRNVKDRIWDMTGIKNYQLAFLVDQPEAKNGEYAGQ